MLIFMEFCAEGTLESLIAGSENGLSESLVRKYTYQLISAVEILHSHGIVHRDIKRMSYNFIRTEYFYYIHVLIIQYLCFTYSCKYFFNG